MKQIVKIRSRSLIAIERKKQSKLLDSWLIISDVKKRFGWYVLKMIKRD